MSKEKVLSLTKYANDVKSKLSDKELPPKHKNRGLQYKQFLEKELAQVSSKIENLKVSGDSKK